MSYLVWFVRGATVLELLNDFPKSWKGKRRTFLLHRQRIRNLTFPTKWINDLQNCNSCLHRYVFDAAVSFRQLGGTCVFIQQRFDQPHKKGLCEICITVMKRSFTRDQKDVHKKRKIARGFPIDPPCTKSRLSRIQRRMRRVQGGRTGSSAASVPAASRSSITITQSDSCFWSFYSTWNIKMRSGNTNIL